MAAEQPHLVSRIVVGNGYLPAGQQPANIAFRTWRAFARYTPVLPCGRIVSAGTVTKISAEIRAGYDAPFPDKTFQAGARAFPALVPITPDDPALPANRAAWEALGRWEKPFLCVFGAKDPILGRADRPLIAHVPGAAGQPHARINGSHFVQEDCGPELAARILAWNP
jgi:haloalkane dehalogenase